METAPRSEFDTIPVTNPTKEDFTVNYNGEPYKLPKETTKEYPLHLAYHLAKKLSDTILNKEVEKIKKKTKDGQNNPAVSQLVIYDNPQRRIALYDILQSKDEVEACLNAFNYDLKGFIGEIKEYDDYVAKQEKPLATSQ